MSHVPADGEVAAAQRSASPVGSLKRKRLSPPSPSAASKSVRIHGAPSLSLSQPASKSAADAQAASHYRSPDSDEMLQSENGDLLRGVGSASSLTSTASSVFSHNSHAHHRNASLVNGLTPLTNDADFSPAKGNSPQHAKSTSTMASSNGVIAASHVPSASRSERPRMLPPPGTAKGYRVVWDPELDKQLSKEERKRATPRKKEFGTEVRYIFHNLLSLHNIVNIT